MNSKRAISIIILIVTVTSLFGGCVKNKTQTGEGLPFYINEIALTTDKVVDMPSWTGKKLNLVFWHGQGTNAPNIGQTDTDTVIRDELTRISGISWDEENSFDNNGESCDAKISKIIATDTWPDFAYNIEPSLIDRLVKADKVWDLTEIIPRCMPNYMKIVNYNERSKKQFENKKTNGHNYFFNIPTTYAVASTLDENYTPEKYSKVIIPEESRAWIWVRDDILKKLYPSAKTQSEIKEKYVSEGKFTKEDLTDVTIGSMEEFKTFLEKINDLNLNENGRKIYPLYTHNGTDNWDILSFLGPSLNGTVGFTYVNYFAYFDRTAGEMVRTVDQPWFKATMKYFVDLIQKDICSKEAIVDNKTAFEQKKNNGEYAILYGNVVPPTDEILKAGGKNYSYRKVLIDIPLDDKRFIKNNTAEKYVGDDRFIVFKTKTVASEQDVEQILRYIDFLYTPIGSKSYYWGPETSGLYSEKDGSLVYNDKELEQDMVFGGSGKKAIYYGITSFPRIGASSGTLYAPKNVYNTSTIRDPSQYTSAWRYSSVEPAPSYPDLKIDTNIWNWTDEIEGLKKFWNSRKSSEDAFTVVFTSNNDEEFEKYYAELQNTVIRNGLDDETMKEWNKRFKEENSEFWNEFINWRP